MSAREVAEGLNAFALFAVSTIGTGILTFIVSYPRSCETAGGTYSCTNVMGTTTMTGGDATAWGFGAGLLVGILALGLREFILSLSSQPEGP